MNLHIRDTASRAESNGFSCGFSTHEHYLLCYHLKRRSFPAVSGSLFSRAYLHTVRFSTVLTWRPNAKVSSLQRCSRVWLGRLDSNQRRAQKASAGVKVRCLTAWRRPITGVLLLRSVALQLVSVLVPGSLSSGFSVASGTAPEAMSRIATRTRFAASISFCSSPLSCCILCQRSGLLE